MKPAITIVKKDKATVDHYFKGDACRATGKAFEYAHGFFWEYEIIEGHRKGQKIQSQEAPQTKAEGR